MSDLVYYDFRIDAWAPNTLPMSRLAAYLDRLSVLFGYKEQVHFLRVRKGSAVPEIAVDGKVAPEVLARLQLVGCPEEPVDAARARQDINDMLRDDNASAKLRIKRGAVIVVFPGCKMPLAEEIVIHEQGELDGVIIRVGGKDDTVPVWIQGEGATIFKCVATRDIARELAHYLFGQPIRVSGNGKWRRTPERMWELDNFVVKTWEPLDAAPLIDVINEFRKIEGSGWNDMVSPQEELRKLRGE